MHDAISSHTVSTDILFSWLEKQASLSLLRIFLYQPTQGTEQCKRQLNYCLRDADRPQITPMG